MQTLDNFPTMTTVPVWIDKQFIKKIVQNSEFKNEMVKVLSASVTPATAKGDNYASEMLRVTIEYENIKSDKKTRFIIIKLSPQEGIHKDFVKKTGLFEKEILMMTNTLKKMNSLVGPANRFSGTAYYVQSEDPVLLVIEDLAPLGFRMANRHAGLDMEHTLLAIRSLARFHAASVAVCEKEPNHKSLYSTGVYSKHQVSELKSFFNNSVQILANEVANWPEVKQYAAKLNALSSHAFDLATSAAEKDDNEFNVLNHGDYWVNNMLFSYENDKPIDHIMVDFQLSVYSSPALDLLYFFNTSLSEEIYYDKQKVVTEEYHKTLAETMKSLECKTRPPTIGELHKSMRKRAFLGVLASMTVFPLVLVDKSKAKDVSEIMNTEGEVVDNPGLKGEAFRKIMTKRLPLYDADGFLE